MSARLPIRWRLTIWYAAFLAGSMFLLGASFYLGTRTLLFGFFEEQLEKQSALAESSVHSNGGVLTIDPNTVANLRDDQHFVRLLNLDGSAVVDTISSVRLASIDPRFAEAAATGASNVGSAHTPEGTILIKSTPILSGSATVGVLQVGASRGDIEDILRVLAIGLVNAGGALRVSANSGGLSKGSQPISTVHAVESGAHAFARFVGLEDDKSQVAPGTLDDGKDLLPQAKISTEQAIAAARTAAIGDIGEIDLEHYQGHLVFNVDVGDYDVKVDAAGTRFGHRLTTKSRHQFKRRVHGGPAAFVSGPNRRIAMLDSRIRNLA